MSFELARVGFYVVAFFIFLIFVKMIIDKVKSMFKDNGKGGSKVRDEEDPFK